MSNSTRSNHATLPDQQTLPPDQAFVVEFTSGADAVRGEQLSGRVEHVVSGQATRFASAGELLEFVQGVLRSRVPARDTLKEEP